MEVRHEARERVRGSAFPFPVPTNGGRMEVRRDWYRSVVSPHSLWRGYTEDCRAHTPIPAVLFLPSSQLQLTSEPFRVHRGDYMTDRESGIGHAKGRGKNEVACQDRFPNQSGYTNTAAPLVEFDRPGHHSARRGNGWLLFRPFERNADAAIIDGGTIRWAMPLSSVHGNAQAPACGTSRWVELQSISVQQYSMYYFEVVVFLCYKDHLLVRLEMECWCIIRQNTVHQLHIAQVAHVTTM